MKNEVTISVLEIVGLLESIRVIEGITLNLSNSALIDRCANEIEWCTSLLVGTLEEAKEK